MKQWRVTWVQTYNCANNLSWTDKKGKTYSRLGHAKNKIKDLLAADKRRVENGFGYGHPEISNVRLLEREVGEWLSTEGGEGDR